MDMAKRKHEDGPSGAEDPLNQNSFSGQGIDQDFSLIHELVLNGGNGFDLMRAFATVTEEAGAELVSSSLKSLMEGGYFMTCRLRGISSDEASQIVQGLSQICGVKQVRVEHIIMTSQRT